MQHFIFEILIEWKQVVVDNFARVSHLVVFNLVKVYSFSELVGLTPDNNRHFEPLNNSISRISG